MPRNGAQILSDFRSDFALEVGCGRCDRRGRYHVGRLLARRGDLALTDFLDEVTAGCPKHLSAAVYDRCGALYMNLEAGRRPKSDLA